MTEFNSLQVSSRDITHFNSFQKKIFFSKADFPISQRELGQLKNEYREKAEEYIKIICANNFNFKPSNIKVVSNSTFHLVFDVSVGSKDLIIRISLLSSIVHDLSLVKEAWVYKLLKEKRVQKLKVFLVDVSRSIVPLDYIILEKIKGVTLLNLSKKRKLSIELKKLGNYSKKVHKIKLENFGHLNIKEIIEKDKGEGIHDSWSEYLLTNLEGHIRICNKSRLIDKVESHKIEKNIRDIAPKIKVNKGSLLVGDLANHNIFYKNNNIEGIVDWEDSISGDPLYDLAFWITGAYYDEKWIRPFLKGYGMNENDLRLTFWTYYLRISLAKSVVRIKFHESLTTKSKKFHERINKGLKELELLVKQY